MLLVQALTSVDVSARISRQGKKFLQQLTEQAALNELMTAVASGDASAMITLYNITKVGIIVLKPIICLYSVVRLAIYHQPLFKITVGAIVVKTTLKC